MIALAPLLIAAAAPPPPMLPTPGNVVMLSPEAADGRMGTDVRINGMGPFRFVVDTGATRTVVSQRVAQALQLPPGGRGTLRTIGGAGPVDLVRIDALTVPGLPGVPVRAPALLEQNIGAAGLLGTDLLVDRAVLIDIPARTMTITASRRRAPIKRSDEVVVVARRRFGGLVLVDAAVGGQPVYVVIDSGSGISIGNLALKQRLERRRSLIAPQPVALTDVAGRITPGEIASLPEMRIGTIRVTGFPAAFADADTFRQFGLEKRPAMLLGMDLLRVFRRVSIDFGTREVRFLLATDPG